MFLTDLLIDVLPDPTESITTTPVLDPLILNPEGSRRKVSLGQALQEAILRAPSPYRPPDKALSTNPLTVKSRIRTQFLLSDLETRARYRISRRACSARGRRGQTLTTLLKEVLVELPINRITVSRDELAEKVIAKADEKKDLGHTRRMIRQVISLYMNRHYTPLPGTEVVRIWWIRPAQNLIEMEAGV